MSSRIKDWKASKALTTRHDRRKEVNEVQRKQRSALVNQLRPGLDAIDSGTFEVKNDMNELYYTHLIFRFRWRGCAKREQDGKIGQIQEGKTDEEEIGDGL